MAENLLLGAHLGVHPSRLWIWDKAVYMDEKRRTWLPIIIKGESSLQVLLRQEDVPLGEAVSPNHLAPNVLPFMWQLYPERRYRGSDSSFWHVVYHIKASVAFPRGQLGDLGGPALLPQPRHLWPLLQLFLPPSCKSRAGAFPPVVF
uniref:T cell leukemia/lymphoma 1A n=1 Tax=Oryctolagus cuniculus TaxID=9986 RepID=G1SNN1_RABIT